MFSSHVPHGALTCLPTLGLSFAVMLRTISYVEHIGLENIEKTPNCSYYIIIIYILILLFLLFLVVYYYYYYLFLLSLLLLYIYIIIYII